MKIVKIAQVANIGAGQSAPQDPLVFTMDGKPFIRAGSLDWLCSGGDIQQLEQINELNAKAYKMKLYPAGTVVFAKSGMSATKDLVYTLTQPCYVVSHLATIQVDYAQLEPIYLQYFWQYYQPSRLIKDPSYPSLSLEDIAQVTLPLPPLDEQRHIAAILEEADHARRTRRFTQSLSDGFLQEVFVEMFGDPVENPMGWEVVKLGDLITEAKDGPHVSPQYTDEKGVPFLSTRNVRPSRFIWDDLKYITHEEAKRQWQKVKPEYGDILYTKGGTTGLAKAVDVHIDFAVWVHIAVLKLRHDKVVPVWLENMLNSSYCYEQSQQLTMGIVNRDLGLKRMPKIEMYLPPFALQEDFAQIVFNYQQANEQQQESEQQAEHLFQTLLYHAFHGEL